MKTYKIIIVISFVVIVFLLFLFENIGNRNAGDILILDVNSNKQNVGDPNKKNNISSTIRNPSQKSGLNQSSVVDSWIQEHSADISFIQSPDEAGDPVGTVTIGSITGDLGETPPFYKYQVKISELPFLLGTYDERNSYSRRANSFLIEGKHMYDGPSICVTYPRGFMPYNGLKSCGGFVFRKDKKNISEIGILLPDVLLPSDVDYSSLDVVPLDWRIQIRCDNKEFGYDQKNAKVEILDNSMIIVLPTPESPPSEARILWLKLDAEKKNIVLCN